MLISFKKVKPAGTRAEDEESEDEWWTEYQDIIARVEQEIEINPLVGFPAERPTCEINPHGWFYPAHQVVLGAILNKETQFVIELGSWFGKSTRFMCATAPNARVFAIDIWDNSFSAADTHYQNAENQNLVAAAPLMDVFLTNCWEYRDRLVPLKMQTVDGLRLLHRLGVKPTVIFVDADHHYEPAKRDVSTALELFPDAIIVGDDWRYPDVQRVAKEFAASYRKPLHVEGNTCWTYTDFKTNGTTAKDLAVSRQLYDNNAAAITDEFLSLYNTLKIDDEKSFEAFAKATKISLETFSTYKGHRGRTMLMLAARHGKPRVAKKIIEMGGDVNIKNKHGECAMEIAVRMGDTQIIDMLTQAGAN
jgi:predicted O-methyltransferase YrrM